MITSYSVPGVYYEPRPRAEPCPLAPTAVAGLTGCEPRVADGPTPTRLIGDPPAGHAFRVNVNRFQLPPELLAGAHVMVPATADLVLSKSDTAIPIDAGGSITYAV